MTLALMTAVPIGSMTVLALCSPAAASPTSVDAPADALRSGNASNAVALATQALADRSLAPRDRAKVLVDRGLAHEVLGEYDAALLDLTEAINAHALPERALALALYDRGVTLDELSRTEDAAGDYSAAIAIDPKFAAALNNRGNAMRRLGRMPQAHADYQASIAAGNPHAEYPNYGLGQLAEASGRLDEARSFYRAALAANPQFALAKDRLGILGEGSAPPTDAPVVLRLPGAIHLRPPTRMDATADPPPDSEIHLRPPRPRTAARSPGAATEPDLKGAVGEGDTLVQLGAWRSQGDAANSWSRIAAAGGTLLTGLSPQVLAADIPGKGRYYRLRAGPMTHRNGVALCAAMRARGLACIIARP